MHIFRLRAEAVANEAVAVTVEDSELSPTLPMKCDQFARQRLDTFYRIGASVDDDCLLGRCRFWPVTECQLTDVVLTWLVCRVLKCGVDGIFDKVEPPASAQCSAVVFSVEHQAEQFHGFLSRVLLSVRGNFRQQGESPAPIEFGNQCRDALKHVLGCPSLRPLEA